MASIDYGKIISRSIEITKKNKWLWVFGLALAVFSGGGGSGGGGGGSPSSSGSILKDIPQKMPSSLPEKSSQVLGEATNIIKDWFYSVPLSTWIFIGIGLLTIICIWIIVSLIIQSWAKGALIYGINQADEGKDTSLISCSPRGIAKIKHLIIFGLISICITVGIFLLFGFVLLLGYLVFNFSSILQSLWLILGVIIAVLSIIVLMIIFAMLSIYAERLIVLYDHSPWQAWKKGLSLSKNNFLPTLIMGVLNMTIGCTVSCLSLMIILLILAVPAIILIVPIFKDGFHMSDIPTILGGCLLLLLLFIYANYLVGALMTVFKFSNWTLLFKEILEEDKSISQEGKI